jgi:hypothetical protein
MRLRRFPGVYRLKPPSAERATTPGAADVLLICRRVTPRAGKVVTALIPWHHQSRVEAILVIALYPLGQGEQTTCGGDGDQYFEHSPSSLLLPVEAKARGVRNRGFA